MGRDKLAILRRISLICSHSRVRKIPPGQFWRRTFSRPVGRTQFSPTQSPIRSWFVAQRSRVSATTPNSRRATPRFALALDSILLNKAPPGKNVSNAVLAPCLAAKHSVSPLVTKREHPRRTERSACLPACVPTHLSSDGYSSVV